jgi:hypothetical protein
MSAPFTTPLLLALAVVAPSSPGPTLAREDTMHTEVPEILVRAPRVTLDEILDRVARGEARRESLLTDESFTATFRIVRASKDKPELFDERVLQVYKKKPDKVRSVLLRHWTAKPQKKGDVDVHFRSSMSEEVVNFAFRPEARRDFHYRIVGRDLLGNHLIYRLAFEPRSPLDPSEPSGIVWVDTNDFVIVRQEVNFSRSPVPIFLKGIDRMVVERKRVDGYWVLWRVLLRAAANLPLPMLGRSFDISMHFDHYAINTGLDDSLFVAGEARR